VNAEQVLAKIVDLTASSVEIGVDTANILSSSRDIQSAVTTMAGAVEELSTSISEIENSARQSSDAARDSTTSTELGVRGLTQLRDEITTTGDAFGAIARKTNELRQVVSGLGQVVALISKIADQTNLLALNATIEAARAGEAGRGFSVVASEVKSLSRQTRESTDTIRERIDKLNASFLDVITTLDSSQSNIDKVVELSANVGEHFDRIHENTAAISGKVAGLADVISQQKIAVELLARNMTVVENKGDGNLAAITRLADQSDNGIQLIESWRAALAAEEIENKILHLAKADHLMWKKNLLDLAIGRSNLKAANFAEHTACRFGRWYQQSDNSYRHLSAFRMLDAPHQKVHHHGIAAAKCFEKGQIADGMIHFKQLETASVEVLRLLSELISQSDADRPVSRA